MRVRQQTYFFGLGFFMGTKILNLCKNGPWKNLFYCNDNWQRSNLQPAFFSKNWMGDTLEISFIVCFEITVCKQNILPWSSGRIQFKRYQRNRSNLESRSQFCANNKSFYAAYLFCIHNRNSLFSKFKKATPRFDINNLPFDISMI